MHSVRSRFALVLGVLALAALMAAPAQARPSDGPSRIVFVAGKSRHCNQGGCRNLDVVRAVSPHGGRAQKLAEIRSVAEVASSNDGTVAVLSKDVAGGGANSGAFVQIYLVHPSGKRTAVFPQRLQRFNATGLGISGNGKQVAFVRTLNDGTPSGRKPELHTMPTAGGDQTDRRADRAG